MGQSVGFTIHFATINTVLSAANLTIFSLFTIHFATINTEDNILIFYNFENLQYTLLLLILEMILK